VAIRKLSKSSLAMTLIEKARLLAEIIAWRLRWDRHDLDYRPGDTDCEKIVSARQAAAKVPDGATVISSGMAGNSRCSAFFWAIRERFETTGSPRDLTWVSVGGQGGRGKAPGSVEEVGLPGLVGRYISGHVETTRSLLRMAEAGQMDLHVMPQGEMTELIARQARGEFTVRSRTGLDTFLDPRLDGGTAIVSHDGSSLVRAEDDELRYEMPPIDVALFCAAYTDQSGNVYLTDIATLTETQESIDAARANGGLAMAVVGGLVEDDPEAPRIEADRLDAVVVNPWNEQTVLASQQRPWKMFTPGGDGDDHAAIEKLRFINRVLRLTPVRGPVEEALGRLGAHLFAEIVPRGAHINIGVGFPEEVCREVYESELHNDLVFTTETGVYGGLPAPGVYFGAAVNPVRFESSAWMFRHYREHLDTAVLGFLQVDSSGNVNVSRRGPNVSDYVGPGGFPSIIQAARRVIFIGTWMTGARWEVADGKLHLSQTGRPKFVDRVDEVTFSGRRGLADGKQVYYVTNVGIFRLTPGGLEMICKMPGVEIGRDILANTSARLVIPADVPSVDKTIVTGEGFRLDWPEA
jgi:propionate CoA-transferase